MYELPLNLTLTILGNKEILGKSQKCMEIQCIPCRNKYLALAPKKHTTAYNEVFWSYRNTG